MGHLSKLIQRDYVMEKEIILETGNLWPSRLVIAIAIGLLWTVDAFLGERWSTRKYELASAAICGLPYCFQAWEKLRVMFEMQHHRSICIDMKLNALLGIVSIAETETDEDLELDT